MLADQFTPRHGIFEANPPFDNASVQATFRHIGHLLEESDEPLAFILVIPQMEMNRALWSAFESVEPFLRRNVVVPKGQHSYQMGLQHQRTGDGERFWALAKNSMIYFFMNDAGEQRWPVTDKLVARLLQSFRAPGQ